MEKTYGFSVTSLDEHIVEMEIHAKSYDEAWKIYESMGVACLIVVANPTAKEDGGWD